MFLGNAEMRDLSLIKHSRSFWLASEAGNSDLVYNFLTPWKWSLLFSLAESSKALLKEGRDREIRVFAAFSACPPLVNKFCMKVNGHRLTWLDLDFSSPLFDWLLWLTRLTVPFNGRLNRSQGSLRIPIVNKVQLWLIRWNENKWQHPTVHLNLRFISLRYK